MKASHRILFFYMVFTFAMKTISAQVEINLSDLRNSTLLIIQLEPIDSHFTAATARSKWHDSEKILQKFNAAIDSYNVNLPRINKSINDDWKHYDGNYEVVSQRDLSDPKYADVVKYRFAIYQKIGYHEDTKTLTNNASVGYVTYVIDRSHQNLGAPIGNMKHGKSGFIDTYGWFYDHNLAASHLSHQAYLIYQQKYFDAYTSKDKWTLTLTETIKLN